MRNTIAVIALSLVASTSFGQKMSVYSQGKKVGTAIASFRVTPAGGVRTTMLLNVASPQGTMTMQTESNSDKTGTPLNESMSMTMGMKGADGKSTSMKASTKVTYSGKVANVVMTAAGKSTTKQIAAPSGSTIADPSVLWFLVKKPAVGATVTCQSFNQQNMKWEKETSTYVGPRTITVGGKPRTVHYLTSKSGSSEQKLYLDDKGNLVKADFGQLVLIAD